MEESWKRQAFRIVQQRQLCSCMNNTKWNELRNAMRFEMPFPPPFTMKTLFEEQQPKPIRIHPRYLERRGRLIPPQVQDASEQLESLLQKYAIPFEQYGSDYLIYGYR